KKEEIKEETKTIKEEENKVEEEHKLKEDEENKVEIHKSDFTKIYEGINQIKKKHQQNAQTNVPSYSLENYKIDKVLKDNKLANVFSLIEPNMIRPKYFFNSTNRPNGINFINVRKEENKRNLFYTNFKGMMSDYKQKDKEHKQFNNKFRREVEKLNTKTQQKNKNLRSKPMNRSTSMEKMSLNKEEENTNFSKTINLKSSIQTYKPIKLEQTDLFKKLELKCLKKYNKDFYTERLDQLNSKLGVRNKDLNKNRTMDPLRSSKKLFLFKTMIF
ncbi:MAG: hypothetical protein MJ252_29615, partial [archaeon]|nr:hypothetical protein [archaeon]